MTIDLQPGLLQWARDRAGLTAEALAEKVGVSVEKVAAWEQNGRITYRQAEKLAGVTHTAFGYLFLAEPPDERLPIPDLRTVGSVAAGRPSPDLLDVIYQTQRRQEWFREYQIAEDGAELEFVGSTPVGSSVKVAAAAIRQRADRQHAGGQDSVPRCNVAAGHEENGDFPGVCQNPQILDRVRSGRSFSLSSFEKSVYLFRKQK